MDFTVVSASRLEPDDHFYLAGVAYRVFSVFSEPQGSVKIKFLEAGIRQRDGSKSNMLKMTTNRHTPFQIIRF